MNKKMLWETFIRTGKVEDYLKYSRANEDFSAEFAEELYPDEIGDGGFDYKDNWNCDS